MSDESSERMVKESKTKIYEVDSRHTLYLKKELVKDSAFPFEPKEDLVIKIDGDRLVIERPKDRWRAKLKNDIED